MQDRLNDRDDASWWKADGEPPELGGIHSLFAQTMALCRRPQNSEIINDPLPRQS
jgi:hypothetical protein